MEKKYPQSVVGGFILNKKKQILLIKSYKWAKGKLWSVPGGKIKTGETIEQAIKRELLEEVGLKVKFQKVFLVLDAINPEFFIKKGHMIFLECECLTDNNNFKLDQKEIQEARWFELDKIDFNQVESFTKRAIKELQKKLKRS